MKRRTTRKCDSFDFIRISPKKSSTHANSISLRDPDSGSKTPQLPQALRDKHYLELPKIHALHPVKIKRIQRQIDNQYSILETRLLLLGYQYRKDGEPHKQNKQDKKDRDFTRKKLIINKQSYVNRKLFANSILSSFGIGEVVLERKKLQVFVEEGNNSRMVKQVLRKRPQVLFVNDKKQANLVWTRFCDYQSSKLTSRFSQEKVAYLNDSNDEDYDTEHQKSTKIIPDSTIQQSGKRPLSKQGQTEPTKIKLLFQELHYHNHLTNHYEISDKKSLFSNLQKYCTKNRMNIFELVPLTFQISSQDRELAPEISDQGFWFIKPGQDTNRGNGISIATGRDKIKQQVNNLLKIGKTALVQQYIDPLLYRNRKFDIRCYTLVLSMRGEVKAYWYREGYIRTCSKQFNYDITDTLAHLTNDAIQKKSPLYGKYEQSNKLSFGDMETYLKSKQINFRQICQSMKSLVIHSIKSVESKLKCQKNQFGFEIFGYDFLIDRKGKVWLIQINTNPCLQFTGSLTSRVIGHMIDNSLKVALDPLLGEWSSYGSKQDYSRIMEDNKYECII